MDVSVIVCTRNRAIQISELLSSMTKLNVPSGTNWELIIVDNGSNDNTPEVIDSFKSTLPIKRVFQPVPGLSNARNAGIEVSRGAYILWTDDDVLVSANWLASYLNAFKTFPDAAIFGGAITPHLLSPTPLWFLNAKCDLGDLLAERRVGDHPFPINPMKEGTPFGANYAVRSKEQRLYRYDPMLGVAPGRRRGGEEAAVIGAILDAKHKGWWVSDANVTHLIPASRQSTKYIFDYYEASGELAAYSYIAKTPGSGRHLPLKLVITLTFVILRFYFAKIVGKTFWVRCYASYAHHHGKLKYWIAKINDEGD